MKRLLINSILTLFLVFLASCANTPKSAYSEWSLQCRATDKYLIEDNGALVMGEKPSDDSYVWLMEPSDDAQVLIKNKKTGKYLQIKDGQLTCLDGKDGDNKWDFRGFTISQMLNCSWYTLSNPAVGDTVFLTASDNGALMSRVDRNKDFASHWTLIREGGTQLPFDIYADSVVDASFLGNRTSRVVSPTEMVSNYHGKGNSWKLQKDISALPQFSAPGNSLVVALYNMALEEMLLNLRPDSTFMTGALWPQTWTRDAVYSIYFSYAWIMPEISRNTLDKQTLKNPREALQDTGTGGSYPISTDRVVWAMAGWEYFLTTADTKWLETAYEGLSNTARKDIHTAFDANVNLFKGETCSMDWRTHTYPNWFTNANIGESFSSGTNALHMFLYDFLGKAGRVLNKAPEELELWDSYHARLKDGINKNFWDESQGMYLCYLYPEFMDYRPSQRVGVMSNGLCALLGAASAEQANSLIEKFPNYPYGAAVIYPTIPDDFAYHNKGIWPVWQTPYMYAAKNFGNMPAMEHMMKSLIRQSAMFLTHKENMTYDTGFDRNTALNSSRQLWSVSAYISMVYRLLFGLEYTPQGVAFKPAVPQWIGSPLSLKNLKYRDAIINIDITGYGNVIKTLKFNGKEQPLPFILPSDQKGVCAIEIEMGAAAGDTGSMTLVEAGPGRCWSPLEPVITLNGTKISWTSQPDMTYYMYANGEKKIVTSPYDLSGHDAGYYSVFAASSNGFESDLSNPIIYSPEVQIYEAESAKFKGTAQSRNDIGYVADFVGKPAEIEFTINISQIGDYALTIRGANGYGPHGVYCVLRSVFVDGVDKGTFIIEATGNWDEWTESNHLILRGLSTGNHTVKLMLNPESKGYDNNMSFNSGHDNNFNIDNLKVVKLR